MELGYLISPIIQIIDNNGNLAVGAKIYVYNANTTVLATTYNDFEGHLNTNPVITDTLGNCTIIVDNSRAYDIVVNDENDNLMFSKKNVTMANGVAPSADITFNEGYGIDITRVGNVVTIAADTDFIATQDDLTGKQNKLYAGSHIDIDENDTISVTGLKSLSGVYPVMIDETLTTQKVYLDNDWVSAISAVYAANGLHYEYFDGPTAQFNSASTYAVGDCVVTSNTAFSASAAVSTPGSWSTVSSKFTRLGQVTWTVNDPAISGLYEGLQIAGKLPSYGGSASNATFLDVNGFGPKQIRLNNGNYNTQYGTNYMLHVIYDGNYFQVSDRDTNNYVAQVSTTSNSKYPILFKHNGNNTNETHSARFYQDLTYNPGIRAFTEGSACTANGSASHAGGIGSIANGSASFAQGRSVSAIGNYSDAVGYQTVASGSCSFAEGNGTTAQGSYSHAEGQQTNASGIYSHAEGYSTVAKERCSHVEGEDTTAAGQRSHAEGNNTIASGMCSHAEGQYTTAYSTQSHAEGYGAKTYGDAAHAEGNYTMASGSYSHAEGNGTTAVGGQSHAEGNETKSVGYNSHAEGQFSTAYGNAAHAEGYMTSADGHAAHAEGFCTLASGSEAHAEGYYSIASGDYSHAEGNNTSAYGQSTRAAGDHSLASGAGAVAEGWYNSACNYSHAEGGYTKALGNFTHAEGYSTTAEGDYSHAEGEKSHAIGHHSYAAGGWSYSIGAYSHAEGCMVSSVGDFSHAEGNYSLTSGAYSHAEGDSTKAYGAYSHAEGSGSIANAYISHAEGEGTSANGYYSHVGGTNSVADGSASFAHGNNVKTSGNYSVGFGKDNNVSGEYNFVAGVSNTASGNRNTVFGGINSITGYSNVMGGYSNSADGSGNVILGMNCSAKGQAAAVFGFENQVSGNFVLAAGHGIVSNSGCNVIGTYNVDTNDVFVVGGGTNNSTRKNLFRVGPSGCFFTYNNNEYQMQPSTTKWQQSYADIPNDGTTVTIKTISTPTDSFVIEGLYDTNTNNYKINIRNTNANARTFTLYDMQNNETNIYGGTTTIYEGYGKHQFRFTIYGMGSGNNIPMGEYILYLLQYTTRLNIHIYEVQPYGI